MKVLLLQDVRGVGRKNEVKEVSDGYARNFLIARKLAVAANESAMKFKAEVDANEQAAINRYKALAEKISKESFEFFVKTGAKGEVFGSVTKEDVRKHLSEKGFSEVEVVLPKPIKFTGEHMVEINFGKGIVGKLKVKVSSAK
ncbi:MAG: large subunit ribosomal protein L9 [Parcubacteria group bacterium Gr01-1014_3]|nr:MAG: large subunit ribosomal protein L9 [Parcubacteria group bacterium Gr01-1014_3]